MTHPISIHTVLWFTPLYCLPGGGWMRGDILWGITLIKNSAYLILIWSLIKKCYISNFPAIFLNNQVQCSVLRMQCQHSKYPVSPHQGWSNSVSLLTIVTPMGSCSRLFQLISFQLTFHSWGWGASSLYISG